jgi:hypothetical protein
MNNWAKQSGPVIHRCSQAQHSVIGMGTTHSNHLVAGSAVAAAGAAGAALYWALTDASTPEPAEWQAKHTLLKHQGPRMGMVHSLRKETICGPRVLATLRSLAKVSNKIPSSPTKRPISWVSTRKNLQHVLSGLWNELQRPGCGVLAVDSEHHSTFSYDGFLCLIQLSTLSQDVIIGKAHVP